MEQNPKLKPEKEKKVSMDTLIQVFTNTLSFKNLSPSISSFYYNQSPSNTEPILLIAIVGFHHKKGSIIEFTYPPKEQLIQSKIFKNLSEKIPPSKILDDILNQLTFLCLPDGCHLINEDNQFFFIQNYSSILYGISCYKQIKTEIEDEQENTRHCVQKAMCILSTFPLFGQYFSKLSLCMAAFFNQNTLKDKDIISQLYNNFQTMQCSNLNINEIYLTFSLRKLVSFSKEKIWILIKLILLEKKILIFGHSSGDVCNFIFTLIGLFPGNLLFGFNEGSKIQRYRKSLAPYGLPLKLFNSDYRIFPLLTLFDVDDIEKKYSSYLIGTTNQLILKMSKLKIDCIVNIDEKKISCVNEHLEKVIKCSKKEKKIIQNVIANLKENNFKYENDNWITNLNINNSNFTGSDDYIRNEFKHYFFDFLINIALSLKISKNAFEEIHKSLDLIKIEDIADSDNEAESTSDKFKNKILKENEKITKKTITKILNDYNIDFIYHWLKTNNYKTWLSEYDPQLSNRSIFVKKADNVTIDYENGDTYIGSLSLGKRNGNGVYTESDGHFVYNGEWENDMKNGTGSLTSEDSKYIYDGEWKNDKKHGNGQLVNNTIKYSGGFIE